MNQDTTEVWPAAIEKIVQPLFPHMVNDCMARHVLGLKKYGVPLRVDSDRNPLQDAYEEALDLAIYLTQASLRRPAPVDEERSRLEFLVIGPILGQAWRAASDLKLLLLARETRGV